MTFRIIRRSRQVTTDAAGAGSAVNSTVRQLGGALGVAVLGSILSTAYRSDITPALSALPGPLRRVAGESIGATQLTVRAADGRLPGHGVPILQAASDAFISARHIATAVSAAAMLLAAAVVLAWLPAHRWEPAEAFTAPARAPRIYGFATVSRAGAGGGRRATAGLAGRRVPDPGRL